MSDNKDPSELYAGVAFRRKVLSARGVKNDVSVARISPAKDIHHDISPSVSRSS